MSEQKVSSLVDAAMLVEPITAEAACGPDLDLEGDPDYFQCVSRIEGLLPTSFFTRDDDGKLAMFDRSRIDVAAESRALSTLLARTRDLRLLVMLGRLAVLNRNLSGFTEVAGGIAALLDAAWQNVHPRGEEGDYMLRTAVLQGLDDMPTVILPLQHLPLLTTRRFGGISYRTFMVANGEAQPREDEPVLDRAAIDRALAEADLASIMAVREQLLALKSAIGAIQSTTADKAGYEQAVSLERLPALVDRILSAIGPTISARDPTAPVPTVEPTGETALGQPVSEGAGRIAGAVTSVEGAAAALAAAGRYFRQYEPSSPAALLVRQAETLVGKSFLDVIRALVPSRAEEAVIGIGADRLFTLSFNQLSDLAVDAPLSEDPGGDESSAATSDYPAMSVAAATRAEALALMQNVAAFYRSAEPSSPIPLLLERAAGMVDRDFLSLLKDLMPTLLSRED